MIDNRLQEYKNKIWTEYKERIKDIIQEYNDEIASKKEFFKEDEFHIR